MGTLNSKDFWEKMYNKFPSSYRKEDLNNDLYLKRYIEASGEGGYEVVLDEVNNLTTLIDSSKMDENLLPLYFKSYGIEVFNGLPTRFLRNFAPYLNSMYSRKGSDSVIEYLSSIITGSSVTFDKDPDFDTNFQANIGVDMDSSLEKDFPDVVQLRRIMKDFLPFFVDLAVTLSYHFEEIFKIAMSDMYDSMKIWEKTTSTPKVYFIEHFEDKVQSNEKVDSRSLNPLTELGGVLTSMVYSLNDNFWLSEVNGYDIITVDGKETLIYN